MATSSPGALAGQEILEELRGERARDPEGDARRGGGLSRVASRRRKRVADAAKEGGFLGFYAERVSEGEQKMLDKLGEALGESE